MLVDTDAVNHFEPIFAMLIQAMGGSLKTTRLAKGVYEIGHFGCSSWPEGFTKDTFFLPYGVCDNYEQVLEAYPSIVESDEEFILTLTPVRKADQPESGGWRWHKWGPYIGTQERTCEYLYDEPNVDLVYTYCFYQRTKRL
jgi:hypothetical protein